MKRYRLSSFGLTLLIFAIAVVVLALTGMHTIAWIVAVVGLLLLAAAYMPTSARTAAMSRGTRNRFPGR